ncbi:VanZ family protein [Cryptosporangium sp. NPDC051539]|uniref:VanZ family protein n=1 Tax=Cryptosporangium sp. NPDC051539 TaxID=3363962 RepID=UPI0037ADD020
MKYRVTLFGLTALGVVYGGFVLRRMLWMPASQCLALQWRGCLGTENGTVLMTLAGLPPAALLVWVLARRRGWRDPLAEVGIVYGTVPWLWLTLMPGPGAGVVPGRVSLVPLHDLATMGVLGIVGNLLVFAALGCFGPLRFAALASVPRILALGAACSILVETAQYVFRLDRVSSVDDVLVNTAGAVLAGLASRPWWRTRAAGPGGGAGTRPPRRRPPTRRRPPAECPDRSSTAAPTARRADVRRR